MKLLTIKHLTMAFVFAATTGAVGNAVADSLVSVQWSRLDTGQVFELNLPERAHLHAMKRRFMSRAGLSPHKARDYVVERLVAVHLPPPLPAPAPVVGNTLDPNFVMTDPNFFLNQPPVPPVPQQPIEEWEVLDEGRTLLELSIDDGEVLRLRERLDGEALLLSRRGDDHKNKHEKHGKHKDHDHDD